MSAESIPTELNAARVEIDEIDQQLITLLARRFAITHEVGLLKAKHALDAVDSGREELKLRAVKESCAQAGLNPGLGEEIFTLIMAEAVRNHKEIRQKHGDTDT